MNDKVLPQVYGEAPLYSDTWLYPEDMDVGAICISVDQHMALKTGNDCWDWIDRGKPWLGFRIIDGRWNMRTKILPLRQMMIVAKDTKENRIALKRAVRTKRGDSPSDVHLALYAMVKNPKLKKKGMLIELDPDEDEAPQGTEDKSARTATKQ